MGCRKTVTEKKLAANRLNAERSTGPRTERGKNTSKFNAVITGLFAKHVVIPLCDGEGSEEQFVALFADLWQEFQPVGPLEKFYVEEMARSMWRLRRATCAEKGSVRRRKVPDIYLHLKSSTYCGRNLHCAKRTKGAQDYRDPLASSLCVSSPCNRKNTSVRGTTQRRNHSCSA